jgi:hypothetical protein
MPYLSLLVVLDIFNKIWESGEVSVIWKEATIIPIPKPNKDPTKPSNYRPISLTSCLCKTMERMINACLVWFLEKNNLITPFQSGFRKNRSTLDHLVRLETKVTNAFIRGEHAISIFFDLEKAYDTTWKYGILKDLHQCGLRGKLPIFIQNFLTGRVFRVRVGSTLSEYHNQEMGVPQCSILSVILFILKINSIAAVIPPYIDSSLFVDYLSITFSARSMASCERKLQLTINKIFDWSHKNGFRFSPTKTVCIHFCYKRKFHLDPQLFINKTPNTNSQGS